MLFSTRIFKGRINRLNYILAFISILFFIGIVASVFVATLATKSSAGVSSILGIVLLLIIVFSTIFTFSLHIRRFHDIGQSGWLILLSLIPFISFVVLICLLVIPSDEGANEYGNPVPATAGFLDVVLGEIN